MFLLFWSFFRGDFLKLDRLNFCLDVSIQHICKLFTATSLVPHGDVLALF